MAGLLTRTRAVFPGHRKSGPTARRLSASVRALNVEDQDDKRRQFPVQLPVGGPVLGVCRARGKPDRPLYVDSAASGGFGYGAVNGAVAT